MLNDLIKDIFPTYTVWNKIYTSQLTINRALEKLQSLIKLNKTIIFHEKLKFQFINLQLLKPLVYNLQYLKATKNNLYSTIFSLSYLQSTIIFCQNLQSTIKYHFLLLKSEELPPKKH